MDAVCSRCQAVQIANARFCHACGAAQPAAGADVAASVAPAPPIVCSACGHASRGDARICLRCGARIGRADATANVAPGGRSALRPPTPNRAAAAGFPLAGAIAMLLVASAAAVGWYALTQPAEFRPAALAPASTPRNAPPASAVVAVAAASQLPASAASSADGAETSLSPIQAEQAASGAASDVARAGAPVPGPAPRNVVIRPTTPASSAAPALRTTPVTAASGAASTAAPAAAGVSAARPPPVAAAPRPASAPARPASAPATKPATTPTPAAKPPAPPTAQARSVKDSCAVGNVVARSLCELRECRKPAHATEAYCVRLIREDEERRQPKAP